MGAVEAALREKPVIITDFGGLKEYVSTPFLIECKKVPVGVDDFLFKKDMVWGAPDFHQLVAFMKECYEKKLWYQVHPETFETVSRATKFFRDGYKNTCTSDSP
jgi:hypothetical protein